MQEKINVRKPGEKRSGIMKYIHIPQTIAIEALPFIMNSVK
jgi:hypothetical protein